MTPGAEEPGQPFPVRDMVLMLFLCFAASSIHFAYDLYFGRSEEIARVDLGDGVVVVAGRATESLEEWDPDHLPWRIYYEVTSSGTVIVPRSYLTSDRERDYHIRAATTEDGSLAAVYDNEKWQFGLFLIYDRASGESWPRSQGDPDDRAAREKWSNRYCRLLRENPQLPPGGSLADCEN